MKIFLWMVLLIPKLVADLIAYVAAPFLGLLVNDRGRLPPWLRWFETLDNTAFGDLGHHERWAHRPLYARFVMWLWRNKVYTFSNEILGARTAGPVRAFGNPAIGDRPLVEGWCLRRAPEGYWHLYVVRRWGLGFFLRMNLGWKLWGVPGGPNFGQYVFSVNPFRRIRRSPSWLSTPTGRRAHLDLVSTRGKGGERGQHVRPWPRHGRAVSSAPTHDAPSERDVGVTGVAGAAPPAHDR